jgi:hypothetical protein
MPRLLPVLASTLAAIAIVLTVASCSHVTPLNADPAASVSPQQRLGSPIVLQAMLGEPATPAGGCPAGYVALSGPDAATGLCYRKLGTPVTITSAAEYTSLERTPSGQEIPGLMIILPAAEKAELTAVTTTAFNSQGYVDISVANKSWGIPKQLQPLTAGQFTIVPSSRNQGLQLLHILFPPISSAAKT